MPRQRGIDEFPSEHEPDILLLTPLIELGSPQLDYVRAARALGIRTALCVWSWDHLSSKAMIRVVPDSCWCGTRRSATRRGAFTACRPERVIVTGAQCFDRWFDREPSRDLRRVLPRGWASRRPPVPAVCLLGAFQGQPVGGAVRRAWVDAIAPRARTRAARHPDADPAAPAAARRVARARGGGSWPGRRHAVGLEPGRRGGPADYFDSLYHAAAVVGLNTSALVEAAIVDRPVFTVLLPEIRENQEGTFHFHHLMTVGEGCLNGARSLDEHVAQLAAVLAGGAPMRANRPFVERFIRPRGVDVAATPVFVEALEQEVALGPPPPRPAPLWTLALRPLVYALVLAGRVPLIERIYWNPVKRREHAANVVAISHKTAQRREKRLDKLARVTRKAGQQAVVRTKTAIKQALEVTGARSAPE